MNKENTSKYCLVQNKYQVSALNLTRLNNGVIENKINDSSNNYTNAIKQYKDSLVNGECPVKATIERNQDFLDQIMEFAKVIPRVGIPELDVKIDVPKLPKIEIEEDDTTEMKNIIRKMNRKTQTFTCDHSALDRKAITYGADALGLRKRSELKIIDDFYKRLAENCWKIMEKDKRGKDFYKDFHITTADVDVVVEAGLNFSAEVMKFNAKYHELHCPKCEKLMKEYEYTKEDIEDRRREMKEEAEKEIKRIQEEVMNINEGKNEILGFLDKYFPKMKRLPVMQIVKMWKAVNKKMIKKEEIKIMLEETGLWKVTNVHNTLYASLIE